MPKIRIGDIEIECTVEELPKVVEALRGTKTKPEIAPPSHGAAPLPPAQVNHIKVSAAALKGKRPNWSAEGKAKQVPAGRVGQALRDPRISDADKARIEKAKGAGTLHELEAAAAIVANIRAKLGKKGGK